MVTRPISWAVPGTVAPIASMPSMKETGRTITSAIGVPVRISPTILPMLRFLIVTLTPVFLV